MKKRVLERLAKLWGVGGRAWEWARRFVAAHGVALSVVPLILGLVLTGVFWDWLTITEPGIDRASESGSTTVRNLGIVMAGLIALPLAVWRAKAADQQARATEQQAETALRQAETAQEDLRNKRYQDGAEMLSSTVLAVRLAGIYALERLAKDHSEQYHIEIMKSLCAFVRHPVKEGDVPVDKTPEDVQAALIAVCTSHKRELRLEREAEFRPDLHGADLGGAILPWIDLSNARLVRVDLAGAMLPAADLSNAVLYCASLTGTDLTGANLTGAMLGSANLAGATLTRAILTNTGFDREWVDSGGECGATTGLTQDQLDSARADPNRPPMLDGLRDPRTDEPLKPPQEPHLSLRDDPR